MAEIPRYQRSKIQFQPMTDTGEAALYGDLAQRLGQWQNRLFQVGAEEAQRKGAEEGMIEGAKPGVPEVEEDPWTLRKKAHRDAALMSHKARITADVRDEVNRLKSEHRLDPEGFSAALEGYKEGLLSEVHPGIQPDVQLLFDDYGGRAFTEINIAVDDQAFRNDVQTILDEASNLTEEALQAARDGDEPMLNRAEGQLMSMMDQAVNSRLITQAEADTKKQELADKAAQEVVIGEFQRILYGQGLDAAEQAYLDFREQDTQALGLDVGQKDLVLGRMQSAMNAEHARLNRGKAEKNAELKALEKAIALNVKDSMYILNHGRLNDASRNEVDRLLVLTQGTKFEIPYREAVESYQAVDTFNRMGMTDQQAFLDRARAEGMDTGAEARLYDRLVKVHADRLNRLQDGQGLDMYYEDGYAPAPDALEFTDEEALREGLQIRNVSATKAEEIYQHDVSPLRPGEISVLNQYFETAEVADQLRLLGIMQDEFSDNFLPAMQDIDKQGGQGLAMAGALFNSTGPTAARLALNGQQGREAKALPPFEATAQKTMERDLFEALRPITNSTHRGALGETVRNIYAGLTLAEKDTTGVYSRERLDHAVQLAMGGSFKWEGSKWGASESYITPPVMGWNEDQTLEWLDEGMTADEVRMMGNPAGFTAEEFLSSMRKFGVITPVGQTVRAGRPTKTQYSVLFNGFPVKNTDGTLFILEYQDD